MAQSFHLSLAHSLSSLSLYHVDTNVSIDYNSIVTFQKEAAVRELKRRRLEKDFAKLDQLYREAPEEWEMADELKESYEAKLLGVSQNLVELKDFLNDGLPWGLVTIG